MSLFTSKDIFFRTDEHRDFFHREHLLITRRNMRFIPVLFIVCSAFFLMRSLLISGETALYSKAYLILNLILAGLNLILLPLFLRPVVRTDRKRIPPGILFSLTVLSILSSGLNFMDLANGRTVIMLPVYLVFLAVVLWLEPGHFAFLSAVTVLLFCGSVLILSKLVSQPLMIISSVLIVYLSIWFLYLHIRSLRMENLQNRFSLEEQYRAVAMENASDPLTGLFNRRYLRDDMGQELARSSRSESPFCVALLDLDNFTAINDNYGHLAGDEVLRETAELLRNSLRLSDRIYRFDGETFLFILTDTAEDMAVVLGQRIREKFEAYQFKKVQNPVTVSIGMTCSQKDSSFDLLIKKAEGHLKKAKENGRNRVVCDSCPQEN